MNLDQQTDLIKIINYEPAYQVYFKSLNYEWISRYFVMEEPDYRMLNHPDEYILQKGGHILMAIYRGEVVGTCALIRINEREFELAKMAVTAKMQGRNIGYHLGRAAIEKAKEIGAEKLELVSNRILEPALRLYTKLGFIEVEMPPSPYSRADIKMVLDLK